MARTLRRLALWTVGTGLAVLVSWFGVQRALSADAVADVPGVVPVTRSASPSAAVSPVGPAASPGPAAGTPGPAESGPGPGSGPDGAAWPAGTGPATAAASAAGPSAGPAAQPPTPVQTAPGGPDIQSYQLTGGRVVLEMTATSARLVSATPEPDWRVQAWQAEGWLRVDFSRDGATSSCFVTWNGHPPMVQTT
ncbi:hypothetical protein [Frankia nepalensis]|uniref:hypothetical protein n=1 Tax=Frankia nepalensis TaxID=1836974 RepID=UPI0027DE3146|nr:hypothetical protein [Frankia nepalensis]